MSSNIFEPFLGHFYRNSKISIYRQDYGQVALGCASVSFRTLIFSMSIEFRWGCKARLKMIVKKIENYLVER